MNNTELINNTITKNFNKLHGYTVHQQLLLLLLLLWVISPWASLGRDQSLVRQLVWLWYACWPLVPKFAGSNPAEAVGFLRAKKSSARLPSEGK